jgi:simple sugar transport system permease protein
VTAESGAGGGMSVNPTALSTGGGLRRQFGSTFIAILLGLLVGALLIWLSSALSPAGFDPTLPLTAYLALLDGSLLCADGYAEGGFGCEGGLLLDFRGIGNALNSATPLILAGLSVAFGFRAGLFNIGAQGQFFLGAFGAAIAGAYLGLPFPLALIVSLLAGALFGAGWGFIPGFLKAWRGAHEVVVTIMLNYVAALWLKLLAGTAFRDPGASFPRTPDINEASQLKPMFQGVTLLPEDIQNSSVHPGIVIAVVVAIAVWFLLFKTTLGFEVRTVGANPNAARYAGIRPSLITVLTMSIAGGLAGLAGAIEILGITRNYPAEYNTTYGFDAIAVALLGRAHPFGVIGAALLFGFLRAGQGTMQRQTDIPIDIITIVQGAIILFVAAEVVLRRFLPRGGPKRSGAAPAPSAA